MHKAAIEPRWLTLEITESVMVSEREHSLHQLARLRRLGCRIAIDDFGTGYSSMAYLKSLPVDEIKIDKSFVAELGENPKDEIIVRAIVDLGHRFGLAVTAEGVETDAAWALLSSIDCDVIQGYRLARPLTADALNAWLASAPRRRLSPSGSSSRRCEMFLGFCALLIVALVPLTGGQLRRLARSSCAGFRWPSPHCVVQVLVITVWPRMPHGLAVAAHLRVLPMLGAVVWVNRAVPGMVVIALGAGLERPGDRGQRRNAARLGPRAAAGRHQAAGRLPELRRARPPASALARRHHGDAVVAAAAQHAQRR